jgi:hypothetical protein
VRLAEGGERWFEIREEPGRWTTAAPPLAGVEGDHGGAERDSQGRQRATGWIRDRLVEVGRRRFDHRIDGSAAEVDEGGDPVARLVDPLGEPGQHGGLGRPRNRQRRSREDQREPDGGEGEGDCPEQCTEIAIRRSREERSREDAKGQCGNDDRPAAFVAGEEGRPGCAGEDAGDDHERRGQGGQALVFTAPVEADRGADVQRREEAGERDAIPICRLPIRDEDRDLRKAGDEGRRKEAWPVASQRDGCGGGEDDAGEGGADRGQVLLEEHHHGNERRPDQPDPGDEL